MKKSVSITVIFLIAQILVAQPGAIDLSFNPGDIGFGHGDGPNSWVFAMAEQSDGKILIGGDFKTYNGFVRGHVARIHPDGTLDQSFDAGNLFTTFYAIAIRSIISLENGKVMIGCDRIQLQNDTLKSLHRLHADGTIDDSFIIGSGPDKSVFAINELSDGKVLIGGYFDTFNGIPVKKIARLHPDGSLDHTFQGPDFTAGYVTKMLLLPDNKIMVIGYLFFEGGKSNHVLRLMEDGSIDTTFNTDHIPVSSGFNFGSFVSNVHIKDNNKHILVGSIWIDGMDSYKNIVQLNEDGSLDEGFHIPVMTSLSFSYPPVVRSLFPSHDGRLLIFGRFVSIDGVSYRNVARLNSDGTLDTSFAPVDVEQYGLAIKQEDGRLVVASWDFYESHSPMCLARLNEDLSYDDTFNSGTGANQVIHNIHILGDQKILISGKFRSYNGVLRNSIAQLRPDGSLVGSFDPGRHFGLTAGDFCFAEQDDGKILISGDFSKSQDDDPKFKNVRLSNDNSIDTTFNSSFGYSSHIRDLKILRDGKIIAAGSFKDFDGHKIGNVLRLNPDGAVDEGFDTGYGSNATITRTAIQADGKILISGYFSMIDSVPRKNIARLYGNGSLDLDFNPGLGLQKYGGVNHPIIHQMGFQQDGRIIAAGNFLMYNDVPVNRIMRLNPDGSLDHTFSTIYGPNDVIKSLLIQPDDKIIIGGLFTMFDSLYAGRIARLEADGSLDTTFRSGTGFNDAVEALALQPDGNILAVGKFTAYDGTGRNRIARITGRGPEGTGRMHSSHGWQVFPNPAKTKISIVNKDGTVITGIRLYDLHGRMVKQRLNMNAIQAEMELGDIPAGVYLLEVNETNKTARMKIVKQ